MEAIQPKSANPIGEKFAKIVTDFLEQKREQTIDDELIQELGSLITGTTCKIVGATEAAQICEITSQRLFNLYSQMPPLVGRLRAGPVWLHEDVVMYSKTRPRKRGRPRK